MFPVLLPRLILLSQKVAGLPFQNQLYGEIQHLAGGRHESRSDGDEWTTVWCLR